MFKLSTNRRGLPRNVTAGLFGFSLADILSCGENQTEHLWNSPTADGRFLNCLALPE